MLPPYTYLPRPPLIAPFLQARAQAPTLPTLQQASASQDARSSDAVGDKGGQVLTPREQGTLDTSDEPMHHWG